MRNVWKFYFGLVKFENELLVTMLTKKLFKPQIVDDFFSIQCAYEAKNKRVTEIVSRSSIWTFNTVSTYDISAIAYVMSEAASIHNTATATTHLKLSGGIQDSYKFASLMNLLSAKAKSNLVYLCSSNILLESASVKLLAEALNAGFKSLQVLRLDDNSLGDDGAIILAEGLKFHSSLQELHLSENKISATGVTALMHFACPLRTLSLDINNIGDDGAREVGHKLKCKSLMKLNLSECGIGIDGSEALADAISSDVIVDLDLSNNKFGLSINELTVAVNFESSTTEHSDSRRTLRLTLSRNKRIGCECSDGIAFLSRFKKLRKLNLSGNAINPQGAKVLTDYLLYSNNCHMFEHLILSVNKISTCATDIAIKLLHHDNIKKIDLSCLLSFSFEPTYGLDLSYWELSSDAVLSFAREFQSMQDFNYNQNYFPLIDINILKSDPVDTQTAEAVLRELKKCNRVKQVLQ